MDYAKLIHVIETTLLRNGDGRTSPIRVVTQYWSLDGKLLAQVDPETDAEARRRVRAAVYKEQMEIATLVDAAQTQVTNLGLDTETDYRVKAIFHLVAQAIKERSQQ